MGKNNKKKKIFLCSEMEEFMGFFIICVYLWDAYKSKTFLLIFM